MTDRKTGTTACAIPYGRHAVDEDDVEAVAAVLRGDWLTTGPMVERFERAMAERVGARHAVAVSSGTAALHAAMRALSIGPGDEVIVPAMTFAATANGVVYEGGVPVFADVDPETLLLDPASVAAKVTPNTKAVIGVDYAGQPCDYDALRALCADRGIAFVADACHSLGAAFRGRPVGSLAGMTVFSFHPVKHITTGEGGMVMTDDPGMAERMRRFRNHGISADAHERSEGATWYYEIGELGFNYRISDVMCGLGLSQLGKLDRWLARRREIARRYDGAFAGDPRIRPLAAAPDREHAFHLYVVRIDFARIAGGRRALVGLLREGGVAANVHYIPVHLHPYYRRVLGTGAGMCPVAEKAYEQILSIPIYPGMSDGDVERVIGRLTEAVGQL